MSGLSQFSVLIWSLTPSAHRLHTRDRSRPSQARSLGLTFELCCAQLIGGGRVRRAGLRLQDSAALGLEQWAQAHCQPRQVALSLDGLNCSEPWRHGWWLQPSAVHRLIVRRSCSDHLGQSPRG